MRTRRLAAIVATALLGLFAACGDGEDRPGQVTSESGGEGSGSVSGTGSASSAGGEMDGGHDMEKEANSEEAFAAGEETTTVDVTLQDYAFVGIPATVQGPNVLFKATVKGSNAHELQVLDDAGKTVGALHEFEKDAASELAVVLKPGTYSVECLIEEGDKTHAELGMKQTLTVS